jgi:hypothetical protein
MRCPADPPAHDPPRIGVDALKERATLAGQTVEGADGNVRQATELMRAQPRTNRGHAENQEGPGKFFGVDVGHPRNLPAHCVNLNPPQG